MGNRLGKVENLRPFVKGDVRINRKGRPKTFDAARELAQQIAHEIAKTKDKDGEEVEVIIDGHYVTVAESVLRMWANSGDPKLSTAFMEWAFGKVPSVTEVTGKDGKEITLVVEYVNRRHD